MSQAIELKYMVDGKRQDGKTSLISLTSDDDDVEMKEVTISFESLSLIKSIVVFANSSFMIQITNMTGTAILPLSMILYKKSQRTTIVNFNDTLSSRPRSRRPLSPLRKPTKELKLQCFRQYHNLRERNVNLLHIQFYGWVPPNIPRMVTPKLVPKYPIDLDSLVDINI